ncbi:hypothetical protein D3C81_2102670 [compost metagenome]
MSSSNWFFVYMKYLAPPLMLCCASSRFDTPMAWAVRWVSIISPRTPVLDVTLGCHSDS